MSGPVYIVCGGTGGHLAPGIATAQRLQETGIPVKLVVSEKEVDSTLLAGYPDIPFKRARGAPFTLNPVGLFLFLLKNSISFLDGWRTLRAERPPAVVAFGGFLSVSYVTAAWLLRIPIVLHEANRICGRSIRFLSGMADMIFLPDGVPLRGIEPRRIRRLGMPLRKEFHHIPKEVIRNQMGVPVHAKVLVVVGGSQGASVLNEWVKRRYKSLTADGIWVFLVSGPGKNELPDVEVLQSDQGLDVELRTFAFHGAMHELFSCADVVLSRAGAGSIAELTACFTPSILVPYTHAADNHQFANAQDLECRGGAILLPESSMKMLYREVLDLIYNDWLLGRLRDNLHLLSHGDAAEWLARFIRLSYIESDHQQELPIERPTVTEAPTHG